MDQTSSSLTRSMIPIMFFSLHICQDMLLFSSSVHILSTLMYLYNKFLSIFLIGHVISLDIKYICLSLFSLLYSTSPDMISQTKSHMSVCFPKSPSEVFHRKGSRKSDQELTGEINQGRFLEETGP